MLQIAVITAAVLLFITSIAARWGKTSSNVKINRLPGAQLPKGSWSLPWIGETIAFYSQGPYKFYSQHIARYGRIFRTHLMGNPTIVTSTPEAARFVLATRHKSFPAFYSPSVSRLLSINPSAAVSQEMPPGKILKTIHDSMHFELLRDKIAKIDRITRWVLSSWDKQPFVVTYQEAKKLAFHAVLDSIAGMAPSPETMKLMDDFGYVIKGMGTSMPFNIPGTSYHMALEKGQQVFEALSPVVKKRRLEKSQEKCTLDLLMEIENANGEKISDDSLQSHLCGLMFAGFHSSAVLFVWLVKFLGENQEILQQVKVSALKSHLFSKLHIMHQKFITIVIVLYSTCSQAEQDTIRMGKISPEDPLSWTDIINMPLTSTVFQETLRMASIVPFLTRRAKEDINYEGIQIPKSWLVHVGIQNFHLGPEYHKDPLKFDPSRFQAPAKPAAFLPFGNGASMCPGRELVKFEALVFVHYLVTTYSWERIGSEQGIDHWPIPTVKGGLPIKVAKLNECVT
ncbi:hypothetical protein O6H91_09G041800 [Diphasiastrum complanatum]|uniref:Uncharacterized protein n=2 Tax=Diphasiastrum complanatum TaxID=34168 RepID=A0ACC2CNG0_DIPCM|nr:hypothetical protein O6H91_09G041800 [Diphasiastrum complanatum]KAJ7543526.1 hypothetical protein O6H91_09G041800 [Diphasiastrum complanatum]